MQLIDWLTLTSYLQLYFLSLVALFSAVILFTHHIQKQRNVNCIEAPKSADHLHDLLSLGLW